MKQLSGLVMSARLSATRVVFLVAVLGLIITLTTAGFAQKARTWASSQVAIVAFVDCSVVDMKDGLVTVICPSRNRKCAQDNKDPDCVDTVLDVPEKDWVGIDEWGAESPVRGLSLRAGWDTKNHLWPVASHARNTVEDGKRFKVVDSQGLYQRLPVNVDPKP